MKWWHITTWEDGCGDYGCNGNTLRWIIAAHSAADALTLLPERESWQSPYELDLLWLPDLSRKRKPFILGA